MHLSKKQVEYFFPESVEIACELKEKYDDKARIIAGGTDLLLSMEREDYQPHALIDITRIPDLKNISIVDSCVTIGAAVTYSEILSCSKLCEKIPFLSTAIQSIGGVQVRNVATMIGNIANASPAADTLPPLYVLNTKVHVSNSSKSREISIEDFILGVRKIDLMPSEIITHISFDLPKSSYVGVFDKLGNRHAMAISVASIAVLISLTGNVVNDIRLALGSVASTVLKVEDLKNVIVGKVLNDESIHEASEIASKAAKPIDDVRGSANYRHLAISGLVTRSLNQIIKK